MRNALFGAAAAAALPAAALILTSGRGLKWSAVLVILMCAACLAALGPDLRLLGVTMVAAAVPIGVQYRLLTHANRFVTFDHWGGAPAEPVLNAVDLPILFLAAVWIVDLGLRKVSLPRPGRFDALVLAFLALGALSAYNTNEPALLAFEMIRYLKYLILFWMLRTYAGSARALHGIVAALLAVAALQGMVAAAQYFTSFQLPLPVGGVADSSYDLFGGELIERVTGLVGHPNTFAAYLVPVLGLGLAVLWSRWPMPARLVSLPCMALAGLALVLTFSRNGLLACAALVLCIAALALRHGRLPAIVVPAVAAAALAVVLLVFGFGVTAPAVASGGAGSGGLGGLIGTVRTRWAWDPGNAIESRWDLLRIAGAMIASHPVLGIGLNSFEENMALYDRTGTANVIPQPVHNAPALVAAETGIASAILFMVLGAILVRASWRLMRRGGEDAWVAGVFGLGTFGSLALMNLFDVSLRKEPIVGLVTLTAALVLSMEARAVASGERGPCANR